MNTQNNKKILIHSKSIALDAIYSKASNESEMCCLVLSDHPNLGGNMNSSIVRLVADCFCDLGFTTLRLNFRPTSSVVKHGKTNPDMSDALDALDWLSMQNPDCSSVWIAGFGYGGDICIRAAMRRPNIDGFISISPSCNSQLDFSSLTPCPNGLIVAGCLDERTDWKISESMANNFVNQKGCEVKFVPMQNADRFYKDSKHELEKNIRDYLIQVIGVRRLEKTAFL